MIRVQREDFDVGAELKALSQGQHDIGAVASFVGLVRDMRPQPSAGEQQTTASQATTDQAMTLEHYPGMTERMLAEIETEAQARWPLAASLIIHRYGRLEPGEQIVLVAAASRHRQAAFEACAFLMDWLKTKAPFWKLEEVDGQGTWVDARESDTQAAQRWDENCS